MAEFPVACKKLEFEKIIHRITQLAGSEPGRDIVRSISPGTDPVSIVAELARVSEMKELLVAEHQLPLDGIRSITVALRKTTVENQILTVQELLDVGTTLRAGRSVQGFLGKRRSQYPRLAEFLPFLFSDKVLEFNLFDALDESGIVKDSASKELKTIRKDNIAVSEQLRKRLAAILRQVSEQDLLQDEIVTTRDARMVIPVKTEYKHRVPGFIHSSSASGATVFIEPAETLDLNNALRELQIREQREIDRILRELSRQVGEVREPLARSARTLADLDALCAKGRYSIEILGSSPIIVSDNGINLLDARHPILLQTHGRENVVPLNIQFGGEVSTLIITGPNAGGKSVALKTVGLSCLCVQSGLHIAASPDSEFPIFKSIFVDMGDDQSIENDLSTFSSHLVSLKTIIDGADDHSLVLLDEIGAGTDPAEGGALGAAILMELTNRRCLTIATTHQGMLKVFAHETPGMANASMEFDQESLRPTYLFRLGVPGSSYALELAQRIGLGMDLIESARQHLGQERTKLEGLLGELERQTQEYRDQITSLAVDKQRLNQMVGQYEEKLSEVRKEIREMKKKAGEEAKELIQDAQGVIERVIKDIRESAAAKSVIRSAKELLQDSLQSVQQASNAEESARETFRIGDTVLVSGASEKGEITELRGRQAVVTWKSGTLLVSLSALTKAAPAGGRDDLVLDYSPRATNEIDLRGMMGDEAVEKVGNFLDTAYVAGLHRVDIIHGKGTGALRKRISELLKTYPHVKSFRLGEWNEGGWGVTVVELSEA